MSQQEQEPAQKEPAQEPAQKEPTKKTKPDQHPLLAPSNTTQNAALLSNELREWNHAEEGTEEEDLQFLYPSLNDPQFARNIAQPSTM